LGQEQYQRNNTSPSIGSYHFSLFCIMSQLLLPPAKRRKTKRANQLLEDDVNALDAVTVERISVDTKTGPVQKKIFVPIPKPKVTEDVENNATSNPYDRYPSNDYENIPGDIADHAEPLDTPAPLRKKEARLNINSFKIY
jgi:hypothetical protein